MHTQAPHAHSMRPTCRWSSTAAGHTGSSSIRRRMRRTPTTARSGACVRGTRGATSTSRTRARRMSRRCCVARPRCAPICVPTRGHQLPVALLLSFNSLVCPLEPLIAQTAARLTFGPAVPHTNQTKRGCLLSTGCAIWWTVVSSTLPLATRSPKQDHQAIALHPSGLPVTAKLLIDGGLLYDDEGVSIKTSKHRMARIVSTGERRVACGLSHACGRLVACCLAAWAVPPAAC